MDQSLLSSLSKRSKNCASLFAIPTFCYFKLNLYVFTAIIEREKPKQTAVLYYIIYYITNVDIITQFNYVVPAVL